MKIWFVMLVLVAAVLGLRFFLLSQGAPTLQEVLNHNRFGGAFDLSLIIASLLCLSLATLSAAKGYEIVTRSRSVAAAVLPEMLEASQSASEELNAEHEKLKQNEEFVRQENNELVTRLRRLSSDVEEFRRIEPMLRKSNIALGKECERLKAENEDLILKINSFNPKPEKKAAEAKLKKARNKTTIKTKASKEKAKRRRRKK